MRYFIPPYRRFALPPDERTECQINNEHSGDIRPIQDDEDEQATWTWSCCGEQEEGTP